MCRQTGVIIYIFQPHVHRMPVVVAEHFKVVAAGIESGLQQDLDLIQLNSFGCGLDAVTTDQVNDIGLQQIKVDRRHLGTEDRIIFSHFFRERNLLDGRGADGPLHIPHLAHPEGKGKKSLDG